MYPIAYRPILKRLGEIISLQKSHFSLHQKVEKLKVVNSYWDHLFLLSCYPIKFVVIQKKYH